MTNLSNGAVVTDLDNDAGNRALAAQGYSVRHIETFLDHDGHGVVTWDAPQLTEADLPY